MSRKLILYIAISLDGYIAKTDDDLTWLDKVAAEGEDYGYGEFIKTVDAAIVGRKTYDKVLSMGVDFPHGDKDCYIITRTPRPAIGNIKFYSGDLVQLVADLKSRPGKNIFCDGGAEVVTLLMNEQLIDEFIISIIPVFLGDGVRLFKDGRPESDIQLLSIKSFSSGLVQLHYQKKK